MQQEQQTHSNNNVSQILTLNGYWHTNKPMEDTKGGGWDGGWVGWLVAEWYKHHDTRRWQKPDKWTTAVAAMDKLPLGLWPCGRTHEEGAAGQGLQGVHIGSWLWVVGGGAVTRPQSNSRDSNDNNTTSTTTGTPGRSTSKTAFHISRNFHCNACLLSLPTAVIYGLKY